MNFTNKKCLEIKCKDLEIVSGGGWCLKEEPCNNSSQILTKTNSKNVTLADILTEIDERCAELYGRCTREVPKDIIKEILSKYFI